MKDDIPILEAKHADLLSLCQVKFTAGDRKKLAKHPDEQSFCRACVEREPRVDFLLKLFSLQDFFRKTIPPVPQPDENAARAYVADCLGRLKAKAEQMPLDEAAGLARETVLEYGAHFSGKLIHSSAQEAFLLAPDATTQQPHLTSRRLRMTGRVLRLDQSKLDNRGIYQRVLRVLHQDVPEDMELDPGLLEAIRRGATEALSCSAISRRPQTVDYRLRQVLLPDGEDYLAVSPLAAAGMSVQIHEAAQIIEEENRLEDASSDNPGKKRRGRPRQKDSDEQPEENGAAEKQMPPKRIFQGMALLFGGGVARNTTLHGRAVQESFFFGAPQRDMVSSRAWRFVFRPWRPSITKDDAKRVADQITAIENSPALKDSVSVHAIDIQSRGALGVLARQCHNQAVDLAREIGAAQFTEKDQDFSIDESLLRARRTQQPTDIDLAIVRQSFGLDYRIAMAQQIVESLRQLTKEKKTKQDALFGMSVRQRVQHAIQKALEGL